MQMKSDDHPGAALDGPSVWGNRMLSYIQTVSSVTLRIEKYLLIALAGSVTGLILLNVVTRSLSMSIFWVDELAIYAMIWMMMVGASVKIRLRKGIAVTLAETCLSERVVRPLKIAVDVVILLFSIILVVLCWIWFEPLKLAAVGFDTREFSAKFFNFIYQEPTNTIGIPKFLVWLIMPFAAITMTIHSGVNLLERLSGHGIVVPEIE